MYPNDLLPGVTFYEIWIAVGIFACFLILRLQADCVRLPAKLQNFVLLDAVAAIALGFPASILAQAIYNAGRTGEFVLNGETGQTFLGGLIGGAGVFLLGYFGVGRFLFRDRTNVRSFWVVSDIAACSIAVAHAFGRLGCLFAGCCHGKPSNAWFAIYMESTGCKVVPVQLFESLFLFALFTFLFIAFRKGKRGLLPIYMGAYGVWRFFIEYARGDERGQIFIPWLSPSQFTSLLLIVGAVVLAFVEYRVYHKKGEKIHET